MDGSEACVDGWIVILQAFTYVKVQLNKNDFRLSFSFIFYPLRFFAPVRRCFVPAMSNLGAHLTHIFPAFILAWSYHRIILVGHVIEGFLAHYEHLPSLCAKRCVVIYLELSIFYCGSGARGLGRRLLFSRIG